MVYLPSWREPILVAALLSDVGLPWINKKSKINRWRKSHLKKSPPLPLFSHVLQKVAQIKFMSYLENHAMLFA